MIYFLRLLASFVESFHSCFYVGMAHEEVPKQLCARVFNHHGDRTLVEPHENRRYPVLRQVEGVLEAVFSPEEFAIVAVVVL